MFVVWLSFENHVSLKKKSVVRKLTVFSFVMVHFPADLTGFLKTSFTLREVEFSQHINKHFEILGDTLFSLHRKQNCPLKGN